MSLPIVHIPKGKQERIAELRRQIEVKQKTISNTQDEKVQLERELEVHLHELALRNEKYAGDNKPGYGNFETHLSDDGTVVIITTKPR